MLSHHKPACTMMEVFCWVEEKCTRRRQQGSFALGLEKQYCRPGAAVSNILPPERGNSSTSNWRFAVGRFKALGRYASVSRLLVGKIREF